MDKNVFENWILGGAQNAESVEREESTEPDGSSVLKLASDVIDYGQADALGEVLRFKMRVQAQEIGLE